METFKAHPQFPHYQIGTLGTIISTKVNKEGRTRKVHANKLGYVCVILTQSSGVYLTKKVHRLVAEAHVPNPEGKPEVNHIDHNKANNRLENLEWVTHRENHIKGRAFHGDKWSKANIGKGAKPVTATPVDGGEPIRWPSVRAYALHSGNVNRAANVCKAIQTGQPSYGMRWEFE